MQTLEERRAEIRAIYYESDSNHHLAILIVAIIVCAVVIAYLIFALNQPKPVDIGITLTAEDVAYSYDGVESQELTNIYTKFKNNDEVISRTIKDTYGYGWSELVSEPTDDHNYRAAALAYLLVSDSQMISEFNNVCEFFDISEAEVASLGLEKIDKDNITKENLLLSIFYFNKVAKWYKAKGLPFAQININRLDFLYNYFYATEIDLYDHVPYDRLVGTKEQYTYGKVIQNHLESYDFFYSMVLKRADFVEAKGNAIKIINTGQEDLNVTTDIIINTDSLEVCKWTTEIIQPGETHICNLEHSCTDQTIEVILPPCTKEELICQ